MGSESSQKLKEFRNNSLLSRDQDSSDYNKSESEEKNSSDEKSIYNSSDTLKNDNITKSKYQTISSPSQQVPITFEWDTGGNSVYVTGNFCKWNKFFLMKKNEDGTHSLTLNLNKGFIQYKFIVDNQWKCNEKFPVIKDGIYLNNYIDTTKWEIYSEKSEATTDVTSEIKSIQKCKSNLNKKKFSNYFPKLKEMNLAHKLPDQFRSERKLNRFSLFNNENYKYLSDEEDNLLGENYSYKKVKNTSHEEICHLKYKKINNLYNNKDNKKVEVNSTVQRYRLKFITFVYYK